MAWSPFFGGARRMLVRANYGAIEVEFLKIAISGQFRKDCSPHSAICQPGEAAIHAVPAAEPWGAGRATERLPGPSREQPQRTIGYLRLSSQGPLVCQAIGTRCVPIGRHKVGFDSSVRVFDESASDHARVRSFFNWAGSRLMSPNPRMSPCSLCSPWFFQVPPN